MGKIWAKNVKFVVLAQHPSSQQRLFCRGEPKSCLYLRPSFASVKVGLRLGEPERSSLIGLRLRSDEASFE